MRWVTHFGGTGATVGIPLWLLLLGDAERLVGLAALLANGVSHLAVQLLKRLVARPRPCDAGGRPLALVPIPDPYSFPSGHAAAATAVAGTLAAAHLWIAPVVLPLAGLVAASRVTLRVHHVGDVVAGVALGLAAAMGVSALLL